MKQVHGEIGENGGPATRGHRIVGSGAMAGLVRSHAWDQTPLGPVESWSDLLVSSANLMLACAFPCLIFWGPEMVQFYNDAFRPLLDDRHPEGLGDTARHFWKDVWADVGAQLEAVLQHGETVSQQRVLVPIRRQGRMQDVWWNYSYSPIFASDGSVAAVLVVCQDVARELHSERALRSSEQQATRVLQSIGDGVIVTDAETRILRINPVAESLTGWSAEECQGKPLRDIFHAVHETSREPVENPAERALRLKTIVSLANHSVLVAKDGTETPIDDSGAPIRSDEGEICGTVLVFRSVEERRCSANLLKESEERLRSIYSTSLEYIGILSPDGRILDCNRAALEFAGSRREDLLGTLFSEGPWFASTPGMPELVRDALQKAAAGESMVMQMALQRPSGDTVHFEFSFAPVFDEQGNVTYIVPEGRDITELKRAQRALLDNEKIAAVGRLASSIAHEINNPLEAVTNLLFLSRHNAISPKVQEYLLAADHELRRVSAIANQTLRFHKQASRPQAVRAEDLFSTVLSIYEGRLRNSSVVVRVRHRAEHPVVCFQGDVRQVLNNLVGNAIDAMVAGGSLHIRSYVATEWKSGRRGVVFTVGDTGAGMSRETQTRIYEPFFTTKGVAGTGLGMWVSREVVGRHRGTLRVRSRQGKHAHGTVFRFFLPLRPEAEAENSETKLQA